MKSKKDIPDTLILLDRNEGKSIKIIEEFEKLVKIFGEFGVSVNLGIINTLENDVQI